MPRTAIYTARQFEDVRELANGMAVFTVHAARPGHEDMTGHPCQHIYPYAKYRAYRSRYTGGSSFTMSIGREITALMDVSETNPSPSS